MTGIIAHFRRFNPVGPRLSLSVDLRLIKMASRKPADGAFENTFRLPKVWTSSGFFGACTTLRPVFISSILPKLHIKTLSLPMFSHFEPHAGRGYQQYRPHARLRLPRSRREIPSLRSGEDEPRCLATRKSRLQASSGYSSSKTPSIDYIVVEIIL